MRSAPHLVRPLTFILPHHEQLWPRWALGLGLIAYDRLAGRSLPRARRLDLARSRCRRGAAPPLHRGLRRSPTASPTTPAWRSPMPSTPSRAVRASIRACAASSPSASATAGACRWSRGIDGEWTVVLARVLINAAGGQAGEVLDHVIHTSRHTPTRSDALQPDRRPARLTSSEVGYALPVAGGRVGPCGAARAGLHADRPGGRPARGRSGAAPR